MMREDGKHKCMYGSAKIHSLMHCHLSYYQHRVHKFPAREIAHISIHFLNVPDTPGLKPSQIDHGKRLKAERKTETPICWERNWQRCRQRRVKRNRVDRGQH
jgi:hypothetical protein